MQRINALNMLALRNLTDRQKQVEAAAYKYAADIDLPAWLEPVADRLVTLVEWMPYDQNLDSITNKLEPYGMVLTRFPYDRWTQLSSHHKAAPLLQMVTAAGDLIEVMINHKRQLLIRLHDGIHHLDGMYKADRAALLEAMVRNGVKRKLPLTMFENQA